jgi:chitinase
VRQTVIGYFESWSLLRRGCANRQISSIRYDSLTHINVAFGYIKPNSYDIHPIPGASIAGFKAITDLKQHAPNLKVWLSLGGWTFSDNDTDTQPVFGDLSSTIEKRFQFFAKLENFMLEWGFDGVDIDWEYPTATDRRGKPQDTENYVSLLREMRDYFRSSRRGWGISFAAPASYWYLRHFNIGEMMKYVDWVNLMTYDL